MRWHCPPNARSLKNVIHESWRINELHLRCPQWLTEKSKSLATRRRLHLHRKKKLGDYRSNTSKESNLLHFRAQWGEGTKIKWSVGIYKTIRWGSLLLCFTHRFFHTFPFWEELTILSIVHLQVPSTNLTERSQPFQNEISKLTKKPDLNNIHIICGLTLGYYFKTLQLIIFFLNYSFFSFMLLQYY